VSFFDEDDEPVRTTARSRPRPRRGSPTGGAGTDSQTLLVRRVIAVVFGVAFFLLLGVAVHSCSKSRHQSQLREYNTKVTAISTESQQNGKAFLDLFDQKPAPSPADLQLAISGYRSQADQQLKQAQALNVPGDMSAAQQSLLIALQLRSDGLSSIAQHIRTALGDEGEAADAAIKTIASQMRYFDSSDVLFESRVNPFIKQALDKGGVTGQTIPTLPFLSGNLNWLAPNYIANKLNKEITSGSGSSGSGSQPLAPGLHGTGLNSTTYGSTTLGSGQVVNHLTYVAGQTFVVTFTNQGENDEFNIKVTLQIQGSGSPITLRGVAKSVAKGAKASVPLKLDRTPPIGSAAPIRVTVAAVRGEKKTDNNTALYPALFSR
jgi:hypothetical protein